jgi:hypothetical protein
MNADAFPLSFGEPPPQALRHAGPAGHQPHARAGGDQRRQGARRRSA